MKFPNNLIFPGLALTLLPMTAHAHIGVTYLNEMMASRAFVAGLLHPLLGIDHLLVMLCIGFWAALLRGKALWALPASFLFMMVVGAGLQNAGVLLATAEIWVAMSVLVCGAGLFLAYRRQPLSWLAAFLTSIFAISHGYVHAAEATADLSGYAAGFLASTALLHGLGILLHRMAGNKLHGVRVSFATVCTLAGTALLIAI